MTDLSIGNNFKFIIDPFWVSSKCQLYLHETLTPNAKFENLGEILYVLMGNIRNPREMLIRNHPSNT